MIKISLNGVFQDIYGFPGRISACDASGGVCLGSSDWSSHTHFCNGGRIKTKRKKVTEIVSAAAF